MLSEKDPSMKDVTQLMNTYRECARGLWNIYFYPKALLYPSTNKWDYCDEFDEICTLLFTSLVLRPLDQTSYNKARSSDIYPKPLMFLKVLPLSSAGTPIQINREVNKSYGYWDHQVKLVNSLDVDLWFVDFFDFDLLSFRDFQYYRVQITNSSLDSELVDHYALIECNYVKVLLTSGEE